MPYGCRQWRRDSGATVAEGKEIPRPLVCGSHQAARGIEEESAEKNSADQEKLKSVRVSSGRTAGHGRRAQPSPGGHIVPFISDVGGFVANDGAGLFAGNGSEEHADADADADASQERRKMGAAAARGEVSGNSLSKALGVAGAFAFGQQVIHRSPHGSIRGKKTEFEEESNPIGAFIAFVQCTHSNFFPRGECAGLIRPSIDGVNGPCYPSTRVLKL